MPLTQIRYFYEVARAGSIREASERLNVTPSSISRQIQNLEHEIKAPLFERRARGMTLTSAGELYMNYARSILVEFDQLHASIEDLRGLRRGHVRVYAVEGIVADALVGSITDFRASYPGVTFELTVAGADAIAAAVQAAEADIGVTFNVDSHLDIKVAFSISNPLYAIASPNHPITKKKKIGLAEVLSYPVALPDSSFAIRKLINRRCQQQRIVAAPALETNSVEALRAFARCGAGLTILPQPAIFADLEQNKLAAIALSDPFLRRSSFDICISADRKLPTSPAKFLSYLEANFLKVRPKTGER